MLLLRIRKVNLAVKNSIRCMSMVAKSLKYYKYGEPTQVVKLVEEKLEQPKDNQVLVKILAAPINPADINSILGKNPVKQELPAIGGNECVAEVLSIGESVTKVSIGQHVVPLADGLGTWTTHAIFSEEQLMPVPAKMGLAEAATLVVNTCTAYRMLKDFVELRKGDCVIQNAANSAVGQTVHQLCKAWNLKSVGIVRDRPNVDLLKEYLRMQGATEVLTQNELLTTTLFNARLPEPRLTIVRIGSKSAFELSRFMADKGVMVTYGGMSISGCGFWSTSSIDKNSNTSEPKKMFDDLFKLLQYGDLLAPLHEMVPFNDFKKGIVSCFHVKAFTAKKLILNMEQENS